MALQFDLFSDYFTYRKNYFTEESAVIKIIAVIFFIMFVISSNSTLYMSAVFLIFTAFCLKIDIPVKIYLGRILPGFITGVVILAGTELLRYSGKDWIEVEGSVILMRILASLSVLLFLSFTTSIHKLTSALIKLKIPFAFIEILITTYRYIFIFLDSALVIRDAQIVRGGYTGIRRALNSLGILSGTLFFRTFQAAKTTGEAMRMRGYDGQLKYENENNKISHPLFWILLIIVFGGLRWVTG